MTIDTSLDKSGFEQGVKGLKSQAGGLTSVLKKLGGAVAAAFAVGKIVQFGKEAVELGSSVTEVQNVVDVAFGDMAYKAENFAASAIENFGMSQLAAKKTASTYMSMAKNMGLSMDQASDMSITLAGLTGDVASFYNISQELADVKLKSVFTGETETLKDLGIVMTQANLEAYALANGISKSMSEMSQAELVTLRYNFVVDQLSDASGDFVRTQDSWANQTRILSMQWQEFMSIIGQALIQVLLPAVRVLNTVVTALIGMANTVNAFLTAIFGGTRNQIQQTENTVGEVASGIGEAVGNQNALTDAAKETNKEQGKTLAGFDELSKLSSGSSGSGGPAGTAGTAALPVTAGTAERAPAVQAGGDIQSILDRLKAAVEPFRTAFDQAFSDISAGAGTLLKAFEQVWTDIRSLGSPLVEWFGGSFTTFLNQFVATVGSTMGGVLDSAAMVVSDLWSTVLFPELQTWAVSILPFLTELATQLLMTFDTLFQQVKTIFDMIWQQAISPALVIITDIWMDLWDGIVATWDEYGAPIFDQLRQAVDNAAQTLLNAWDTIIKPVWDTLMSVLDQVWNEHFKPLWDNVLEFVAMLAEAALQIYNSFIQPLVNWFIDTFGPPIAETISMVVERIGTVLSTAADVANGIIEALKGVVNFVAGVFTGDWERAWEGIQGIFTGIWNGIVSALEGAVNFIIDGVNWIISQMNKLSFTIPDWLPGGGQTIGFNIPRVQEVRLPRLARGAVIPPNRAFMAVLGDQRSGNNIEAPESLIRSIVREESGAGNAALLREILAAIREGRVMMVDRKVLASVVRSSVNTAARASGGAALKV